MSTKRNDSTEFKYYIKYGVEPPHNSFSKIAYMIKVWFLIDNKSRFDWFLFQLHLINISFSFNKVCFFICKSFIVLFYRSISLSF